MGSVNAIYKTVPFLGQYRFTPLSFERAAVQACAPYMLSCEATFLNWAVFMLRSHNKGVLQPAIAEVQRTKRTHYSGIFKAYSVQLERLKARLALG